MSEDEEFLNSVFLETEENQRYCKGDHPFNFDMPGKRAVCLSS